MHQYIKVSGTPYERGFQYGSQAKERIRKVIDEYKVLFEKEAFITWDKAYELSKPYRKEIEKYRPDLVEEMQGIADGAGLDFNTILTLNCRSEIMVAKADVAEDAARRSAGRQKPAKTAIRFWLKTGIGGAWGTEPPYFWKLNRNHLLKQ